MDNDRKTYEVEVEGDKFYIQILAAERKTYGSGWRGDGETEVITGRVRVATDAKFEGRVGNGLVKVRGRAYAMEHTVSVASEAQVRYSGDKWSNEPTYRGGYRNDKNQQVKYEAKAYGVLRTMEHVALDKFDEENPDWERESTRLLFERERDNHRHTAALRRDEAAAEDRKAAVWTDRLNELLGA